MKVALLYGQNVFQTGVKRYAEELERGLRAGGDDVARVDIVRRELRIGKKRFGGFVGFWLARLLTSAGKRDVVHALAPTVAVRGTQVVTVHDLVTEMFPEWYQRDAATRLDTRLDRAVARRVPWLIADSEVTRQEVIRRWAVPPDRIVTVPLGIDHAKFHPSPVRSAHLAANKPNLVYTGDDNPRKNLLLAVKAVAALKDDMGVDARFLRLGPTRHPDVHEAYRRVAADHGVDLIEPGFVDDKELVAILSHADAFLWPPVAEGFGFPPLEAMACGAPVVALDTPINREICGEVTRYHANDPRAAAEAIATVLRAPPPREASLAHARTFTWERTVRETRAVYARAMGATP